MNSKDQLYAHLAGPNGSWRQKVKGGTSTHNLMAEPFGSFCVPDKAHPKLYRLLAQAILDGYRPNISERHRDVGPVVVDLDFAYAPGVAERQYDRSLIEEVTQIYAEAIEGLFEVDGSHLLVHVYEKESPNPKGAGFRDGLHMVWPYVRSPPEHQYLLRQVVIERFRERKTFGRMSLDRTCTLEEIVDKGVIRNSGWSMYGCCKNQFCSPYLITGTYVYGDEGWHDVGVPEGPPTLERLVDAIQQCSIRSDLGHPVTPLRPGAEVPAEMISPSDHRQLLKDSLREAQSKARYESVLKTPAPKELSEEVGQLMSLLSDHRAVGYSDWIQIGMCLKSIDPGLADVWLQFSQRCPEKYDREVCLKRWSKFEPRSDQTNTLHWLARHDSPDEYRELMADTLSGLDLTNFSITHQTIADVLHREYRYRFKCSSIDKKIWYEFRGHRWQLMDSADNLFKSINNYVVPYFQNVRRDLVIASADKAGFEKKLMDQRANALEKKIESLGDLTFKKKIVETCSYLFQDRDFDDLRDENHMLLGCRNGVFDFNTNQFRPGYPDDNISMSTHIDYQPYDPEDKYVRQVMRFIHTIQTEEENAEYILTLLSTCLTGSVADESLYILVGVGSNGKTKLMELVKKTLGDYYRSLDVQILTNKRAGSSAATPEIADKKGARMCVMDEPEKGSKLNIGYMKNLTGGDELTARALYCNQIYFRPQFKLFMVCNHIPENEEMGTDISFWRRLKKIDFNSVFYKPNDRQRLRIKKLGPGEFDAEDLSRKMRRWGPALLSILVHYHINVFQQQGLRHPQSVIEHTLQYQRECDKYIQFMDDSLENTGRKEDQLTVTQLVSYFREWSQGTGARKRCPTKKEMTSYLTANMRRRFDAETGRLWGYIRVREDLDDIDGNL